MDAGCGTGRLTGELLNLLPHGKVVAVDLSENMLRAAREHLAPEFGNRVSFVAADLQYVPFDTVFDGIFSTAAFHWVLDHRLLFTNLYHSLRPGGWLCAQCGGGPNLARLRERVKTLFGTAEFAPFFANFSEPWIYNDADTAAQILSSVGFVNVETSLESVLTVLEDRAKYSDFVRSVILREHLRRIPDPSLPAQFVEMLTQQAASDDPPFSLDYWRLNLRGNRPHGNR
jgi:trans-aconitate 2-methyltransferase